MKAVFQHLFGTTREWEAENPVPHRAALGFELAGDGRLLLKVGDGKRPWSGLPYFGIGNLPGIQEALREIRERIGGADLGGLNTEDKATLAGAVNEVLAKINSEASRAQSAEGELSGRISTEAAAARAAEAEHDRKIQKLRRRAGGADAQLAALGANKIDKSAAGEGGTLMRSLGIGGVASNSVTAAYESASVDTGEPITTLVDLPVASEEKAGVMPAESFRRIGENTVRIAALENRAVHYPVELDSENPAQEDLQRAYGEASGNEGAAPDQATLDDSAFKKSYTWYETKNEWVDRGNSAVPQFGNGRPGTIQGEDADGKVFAEHDGTGSVVGWSGLKARVGNAEEAIRAGHTHDGEGSQKISYADLRDKPRLYKPATLVIGTTQAGHTAAEVDFLCTGTDDHDVINAAIAALPEGGGKIVIREGTYILRGPVVIDMANVFIEGAGAATVLKAMADINSGAITVAESFCKIAGLKILGYSGYSVNAGILINGSDNTVSGNICGGGLSAGIAIGVSASASEITGNTCLNTGEHAATGIAIAAGACNNIVSGNSLYNTSAGSNHFGIVLNSGAAGNIVSNNNIVWKFALYIRPEASKCVVTGNRLNGAYTVDGQTGIQPAGGGTSIAALNSGVIGLNIWGP